MQQDTTARSGSLGSAIERVSQEASRSADPASAREAAREFDLSFGAQLTQWKQEADGGALPSQTQLELSRAMNAWLRLQMNSPAATVNPQFVQPLCELLLSLLAGAAFAQGQALCEQAEPLACVRTHPAGTAIAAVRQHELQARAKQALEKFEMKDEPEEALGVLQLLAKTVPRHPLTTRFVVELRKRLQFLAQEGKVKPFLDTALKLQALASDAPSVGVWTGGFSAFREGLEGFLAKHAASVSGLAPALELVRALREGGVDWAPELARYFDKLASESTERAALSDCLATLDPALVTGGAGAGSLLEAACNRERAKLELELRKKGAQTLAPSFIVAALFAFLRGTIGSAAGGALAWMAALYALVRFPELVSRVVPGGAPRRVWHLTALKAGAASGVAALLTGLAVGWFFDCF